MVCYEKGHNNREKHIFRKCVSAFLSLFLALLLIGVAIPSGNQTFAASRSDIQSVGWELTSNGWYYRNTSGNVQTGWVFVGDFWYWLGNDGKMTTGWQYVNGSWYYMNESGVMQTGWQHINGNWYYLASDGAMAASQYIGGYWLNGSGSWTYPHQASWRKNRTGWWYGDASGWYAANAWYRIDNQWYYFDRSGYIVTGWRVINGTWYYMNPSGAMLENCYINGYWLSKGGAWTYPYQASWRQNRIGWWYGDASGWYATNSWYYIDNQWYWFDQNGYMVTGWENVSGTWYFFDDAGHLSSQTWNQNVTQKRIHINGLTRDYKIVVLNDMHIICPDDTDRPEWRNWMRNRYTTFAVDANGTPSSLRWNRTAAEVNAMHPDLVIMAGDMIDHISERNIACFKKGLAQISAPVMYIRSDHDYYTGWTNYTDAQAHTLQNSIMQDPDVWNMNLGELQVVGINNSVAQITDSQLNKLQAYLHNGKPTIIATHVPYASLLNNDLIARADQVRGYANFWGADKQPDANTKAYMDMVYSNDSSVKAVLAGHLHFDYDTMLDSHTSEYVFAPGYAGNVAVVTVTGH